MTERPAKPFDTTLRELVQADPRAWLALAGWPTTASVEVLDSNVSALQAEVDAAIRVDETEPWVAHLEFQTSYDPDLANRVDDYNRVGIQGPHDNVPARATSSMSDPQRRDPAPPGRRRPGDP